MLKVNYRNTSQIVAFARRFAADVIGAPGVTADDEHAILLPEDAGRQGLEPDVRRCVSVDAEAHCVAEWFLDRKKAGYEWSQMACLYPEHLIGARVAQILAKHDVPIDMAKDNRNRVSVKRVAVRFLSMHNAKGLEFPCVAIAGLGLLGAATAKSVEECVRLTYVGVTRATHEALLTYSSESGPGAASDRVDWRRAGDTPTRSCRRSSGGSPAALPHSDRNRSWLMMPQPSWRRRPHVRRAAR